MSETQDPFGELRSLIAAPRMNLNAVLAVAKAVWEEDNDRYEEEVLPFLMDHDALWRKHPKRVRMDGLFVEKPYEHFLYYHTELFDHSNLDPLESFAFTERLVRVTMSDFREEECHINWEWFSELPWDALERLVLLNLGLQGRHIKKLFTWHEFDALQESILGGNQIGMEGIKSIAGAGVRFRELQLEACALGDAEVTLLAQTPMMSGLEVVVFSSNKITDVGVQALATSPHMANLKDLNLGFNKISDAGVLMLEDATFAPGLTSLTMWRMGGSWGPEALAVLDAFRARGVRVIT